MTFPRHKAVTTSLQVEMESDQTCNVLSTVTIIVIPTNLFWSFYQYLKRQGSLPLGLGF